MQNTVLKRLDQIEDKLDGLAVLIEASGHSLSTTAKPRLLLVGWKEIAAGLRKSPRTLRRYVKREGLPVVRWGRHVVTTPGLIDNWLVARERAKGERPWNPLPSSYGGPSAVLNCRASA